MSDTKTKYFTFWEPTPQDVGRDDVVTVLVADIRWVTKRVEELEKEVKELMEDSGRIVE